MSNRHISGDLHDVGIRLEVGSDVRDGDLKSEMGDRRSREPPI